MVGISEAWKMEDVKWKMADGRCKMVSSGVVTGGVPARRRRSEGGVKCGAVTCERWNIVYGKWNIEMNGLLDFAKVPNFPKVYFQNKSSKS